MLVNTPLNNVSRVSRGINDLNYFPKVKGISLYWRTKIIKVKELVGNVNLYVWSWLIVATEMYANNFGQNRYKTIVGLHN